MDIQSNTSSEPIHGEETKSMESSSKQTDIEELRKQLQLSQKREHLANLRLTVKEKQLRDLMDENESMKRNANEQNKSDCTLVDHAVGVMFTAMRDELRKARRDAKLAALELRTLKSGPESNDSKELAALCRKLEKENAELRDEVSRTTRLETLLAYRRKTAEGLRKRCRDFDDILAERDEEIKRLQAELARAHEENARLRRNLDGNEREQAQEGNQTSEQSGVTGNNDHHGNVSVVTNENIEEVVLVSSPESTHEEMEEDDQIDRFLAPGASAAEAVNVSSPESIHEALEPETISSDEQDAADASSSKESSVVEGCS